MKKINMIYVKGAEIGTRKMQSYPLGIMLMRSYAYSKPDIRENVKIDIDVIDYDIQDEAYVYQIYREDYDMVLFSTYIWNISRAIEIARKIKLVNPETFIGMGGPEVDDALHMLEENECIDFISVGEGEISFVKIIRKYLLEESIDLRGVVYRNINKKIICGGESEILQNLDEIPSIVTDSLVAKSDMLLFESSRGCPFQCKYCCWANKSMRYYSLERVERDLQMLLAMENGTSLYIIDSELDINIERAKKIIKMIIKYNIHNKIIQGYLGFHLIDEELLELCKNSNFKFGIGIQSVNQETLNQCGRTWFNVLEFEKNIEIIKKYCNMKEIEFQLIMGLPGDNYRLFRENLQWCSKLGATNITANRLYILPGTFFYYNAEQYQIKYDKQPYHLVYSNYSYSYNDIMKSEALLVAFQISKSIFGQYESIRTEKKYLNIWDYIDSLVEIIEEKELYSQGRQESQIVEKVYAYEDIMIYNLEKMECAEQEFQDFIRMQFTKKRANTFFRNDRIIETGVKKIKINGFFIAPFVLVEKDKIRSFDEWKILLLHDFRTNKIKKIRINNAYIGYIVRVLDDLIEGIEIKKIDSYVSKNDKIAFLSRIYDEGLCYYTD